MPSAHDPISWEQPGLMAPRPPQPPNVVITQNCPTSAPLKQFPNPHFLIPAFSLPQFSSTTPPTSALPSWPVLTSLSSVLLPLSRPGQPSSGSHQPPTALTSPVRVGGGSELLHTPGLHSQPSLQQPAFASPLALELFQAFLAVLSRITSRLHFGQTTQIPLL